MEEVDLAYAGIARQAELLREREISSAELVDLYLGRIERINPRLNAFTEVFAEEARAGAAAADTRLAAGDGGASAPLLGVPVALKDEVEVAGKLAQHGTRAYSVPAAADSAHWARLRGAGAILLAKTTLPELAICGFTETETWGETRNPWNPAHTTGGSSGGSAAAVAAGLVGAASASDGGGSIRIPAANCGLFGLKPQRGRISLAPEPDHWLGLSATGCVARRVADAALWLDVAAGPEPVDNDVAEPIAGSFSEAAGREPGRLRFCWSTVAARALAPPLSDDRVEAAVERVAGALGELGHVVEQRDPDWGLVGTDFANVYLKGIEQDYDRVPHPERLEPRTRGFKRLARLIPAAVLKRSLAQRESHAARVNRIFEHCDVLITPTVAVPPVRIGRWAGQGALRTLIGMSRVYPFTPVWNYLGQPAASIPAGQTAEGLPLAVQLIAPPNREDILLSVAAQLERALDWPARAPAAGRLNRVARALAAALIARLPAGGLRSRLFAALGWSVDPGAVIGLSWIDVGELRLGPGARIGHGTRIGPLRVLELESRAMVGSRCRIAGRADGAGSARLAEGAAIVAAHFVDAGAGFEMGRFATLAGRGTQVWTHGWTPFAGVAGGDGADEAGSRSRVAAPVRLAEDVYVGSAAILLPAVELAERVTVGAGAVVGPGAAARCGAGETLLGNPASTPR